MCGFVGFVSNVDIQNEMGGLFDESLLKLSHRGPDGSNVVKHQKIWLGHRRLSIIDLSEDASQPMRASDRDVHIVFNGEIYNHEEFAKDIPLKTKSDTEVLLEGFLKYGVEFLTKIRGIYAFVIYHKEEEKLYMYRDPAGVKPLYYTIDDKNDELIFASEIKAILPLCKKLELDESVLKQYIHLGYCPEPNTIYKNIMALEPGHLLTYDLINGTSRMESVSVHEFSKSNSEKVKVNVEKTDELLKKACIRNLVSDVDVAVALSGGIDSSLVLAYSNTGPKKTKAITVTFDEKDYDESSIAMVYAKQLDVQHLCVSTDVNKQLGLLNRLLIHFDQPFADSSLIPFYFLNKEASKYSKVLIGGDSGDEIHNGYIGFSILPLIFMVRKNKWLSFLFVPIFALLVKILSGSKKREFNKIYSLLSLKNDSEVMFEWNAWFPAVKDRYSLYPFKFDPSRSHIGFVSQNPNNSYSAITKCYFKKRMQSDFLRKSDMMSMINSVEFRVPMLDEDLVRFSLTIPYKQKSTLFEQKKILRKIHSRIYPKLTSKLSKKGFSIPLDNWLGKENLHYIKSYLLIKDGIVTQYVKEDYLELLFSVLNDDINTSEQYYCSRPSAYQRILILYALQLWYIEIFKKWKSRR